jgi:hypothetical protein
MGEYKVLSNKENGVPCDRMVRDSIFSLGKDNELNLLILGTLKIAKIMSFIVIKLNLSLLSLFFFLIYTENQY